MNRIGGFVHRNILGILGVLIIVLGVAVTHQYFVIDGLRSDFAALALEKRAPVVLTDNTPIVAKLSDYKGGYETTITSFGEYASRPLDMAAPAQHYWMSEGRALDEPCRYDHLTDWNNDGDVKKISEKVDFLSYGVGMFAHKKVIKDDMIQNHGTSPKQWKFLEDHFPAPPGSLKLSN